MTQDYTLSWQESLHNAQRLFSHDLVQASKDSKAGTHNETWLQYGQWTRTNSDRGESIKRRHHYFTSRMVEYMGNLTPRDPKRAFNDIERQLVYWRDNGKCQKFGCGATVEWAKAEIHHVIEHQFGGQTVVDNGALMHKECHPKGEAALEFAERYKILFPERFSDSV
ncbi:MAG: HNH endonuclease signature motif containing protein [Chloroflexota bacterium]|nr:HNH endonuclease signature motif containing protein [Chloroflexota bacterium]